jgi:flavin-dependent dehydrogenase
LGFNAPPLEGVTNMEAIDEFASHYDAVVVGARCAGAATAMLLARGGARVLVVDRSEYGTDTMSTHALMRTGVLQLSRWGVLPTIMAESTPAIRRTTFHYGAEPIPIDVRPDDEVRYLCAPRRTVLDRALVDAAQVAGADVRHGVAVVELRHGRDRHVTGVLLRSRNGTSVNVNCELVIGADGRQSTVAGLVGAQTYLAGSNSTGCVFGYFENVERDGSHWHFVENAAAGVIPTNHGLHCVFATVPGPKFGATFRGNVERAFMDVLALNSAQLAQDVDRARLVGRLRGFAGIPGFMRQSYGPGWALVGDSGYFKDPSTAHGITDALRDAELLARAVLDGSRAALTAYQHERDALSGALFQITDSIASFRWNLEEVKALHAELSTSMRAEFSHMASSIVRNKIAA